MPTCGYPKSQIDGDGFPRRLAINRYAAANDFSIADVYEERGVPGSKDPTENLASRPA
jgi:hypothetical protein